jgi:lycopene beta-cyclase
LRRYDAILVGGGAAGLSLAYHLLVSPLRDRRILIIDRDRKGKNDRTWCFWSQRPTHFSPIYFRSWEKCAFRSERLQRTYDLSPYRYNMLRGLDFYEFTRSELSARPNIDFITAPVDQVWETPEAALVSAGGETFEADWIFDSRFTPDTLWKTSDRWHYLRQHFVGWEVETNEDCFDPAVPILFDFRTPQLGSMRFIYVLPFTPRNALVEYTIFSPTLLTIAEYESGLQSYLREVVGAHEYTIHSLEKGDIPMTDHPLTRRTGMRILNIGTRGGRVKPSSGYAFMRIQQDSAAIMHSLERYGDPFHLPQSPPRYRLFDSMLLQILYRQGHLSESVFTALFQNNPIHRIFSFLDETGGVWDNLKVMASVPALPFMRAWARLKILRTI